MGVLDRPARRKVAIGVLGQSNEHGAVSVSEAATYPQAFRSLRKRSVRGPLSPAVSRSGGYWYKVHDDLYDAGWDATIRNGAVGSASMINDFAGIVRTWASSTIFYRQRPPQGPGDRGYTGDLTTVNGGVFRCVAGNDKFAINHGYDLTGPPGRGDGYIDSVVTLAGLRRRGIAYTVTVTGSPTGGTFTLVGNGNTTATIAYNASTSTVQTAIRALGGAWATAVVHGSAGTYTVTITPGTTDTSGLVLGTNSLTGGAAPSVTIADLDFVNYKSSGSTPFPSSGTIAGYKRGQIVNETPSSGSDVGVQWEFVGFQDATPPNGNGTVGSWPGSGYVMTDGLSGMGFDPLGLLHRLHEEMQRVDADRKIIYIANGQADVGGCSTTANTVYTSYRDACINVATFFLNRGYEVMLGVTNYSPATSATANQWANLGLSVAAALTTLEADSTVADRVHAGPNLYSLMGTTGPMASSGAFLAADNIHLNGRGCVGPSSSGVAPAGEHVADSILSALADPPTL